MPLSIAVASSLLLWVATSDASCIFQANGRTVDFTGVSAAPLEIHQTSIQDSTEPWQISLCDAQAPDPKFGPCSRSVAYAFQFHNHQRSKDNCQQSFPTIASDWTWSGGEARRTVSNVDKSIVKAVLHVTCGDTLLSVDGPAPVSGTACGSSTGSCTWDIHLKSSTLCAAAGVTGGLGGGFWFLLILLLALVVYVAGMVTFNYVKREKRGVDLAPHPRFWKALPGLAKDGVFFAKDKAMGLAGRGDTGEYKNVT